MSEMTFWLLVASGAIWTAALILWTYTAMEFAPHRITAQHALLILEMYGSKPNPPLSPSRSPDKR